MEVTMTKEEANYLDARRELLMALVTYMTNAANAPRSDDPDGAAVWDAVEEAFGYRLRVRAGLYAMHAAKVMI
jgi:hypothetical protein